jgi:predicted transglutaminase-like cysteine proteinase
VAGAGASRSSGERIHQGGYRPEHWGVEDRWDFAEDGYGDCEDYQLIKRRELVKAGLPRRAFRMTVVNDEVGDGHGS